MHPLPAMTPPSSPSVPGALGQLVRGAAGVACWGADSAGARAPACLPLTALSNGLVRPPTPGRPSCVFRTDGDDCNYGCPTHPRFTSHVTPNPISRSPPPSHVTPSRARLSARPMLHPCHIQFYIPCHTHLMAYPPTPCGIPCHLRTCPSGSPPPILQERLPTGLRFLLPLS